MSESPVDWSKFRGPEYYQPKDVPRALAKLTKLENDEDAADTYNAVLSAIGNNHCGTLYEAAAEAVDFVLKIALEGATPAARGCALEILIDMISFDSDPTAPGTDLLVRSKVLLSKQALNDNLASAGETQLNRASIASLIEQLTG